MKNLLDKINKKDTNSKHIINMYLINEVINMCLDTSAYENL